ncbi:MAG: DUF2079 domain-containing protein [Oscillospiraceae bacterium]|nr:DUF2079 domain-containing protein [Oscillospiraceae bacterium]
MDEKNKNKSEFNSDLKLNVKKVDYKNMAEKIKNQAAKKPQKIKTQTAQLSQLSQKESASINKLNNINKIEKSEKTENWDINKINSDSGAKKVDYDRFAQMIKDQAARSSRKKDVPIDKVNKNDETVIREKPDTGEAIEITEIKKVDYNRFAEIIKRQASQKTNVKSAVKKTLSLKVLVILLFAAYIILNTADVVLYQNDIFDVQNNVNINLIYFILTLAAVFAVIFIIYTVINIFFKVNTLHRYILFFSSMTFSVGLVTSKSSGTNIFLTVTVLAVLFYIIDYSFRENDGIKLDSLNKIINFKATIIIVSVFAAAYILVIGEATILRYMTYSSSTYDFGIFAQMFENMAKTGLQTTSVERNMQMSHFAVHFSPVYYLFLPIYMIFRSPECLLAIQAAMIAAGVFPLVLIAKKFNFSNSNIILISLTYLFYPALTGGAFFDFHENKFLTVLILWLLYFIVCERYLFVYIFAFLTLLVKEDAFLYVFFIGLYIMTIKNNITGKVRKKNIFNGIMICVISIIYFICATMYLKEYGLGVMTYRFEIFLRYYEDGFGAIIANVFKNPALLLDSLLSVPEKINFVIYMLVPLCFLPFATKKLKTALFIIPMIIINLATDYIYQYDIGYQYTYGVAALLFFLTIKNLSEFSGFSKNIEIPVNYGVKKNAVFNSKNITKICVTMACFSYILFMSTNFSKIENYNFIYNSNARSDFTETNEILSRIPMDASVTANAFIVPHLIKREKVYSADITDSDYFDYDTDYIVNDLRGVNASVYKTVLDEIKQHGYIKVDAGTMVDVFKKEMSQDSLK